MDPDMLPYMLNRLTSRANQLWVKQLREHGLTIGRWHVLSVLARYDGSRIGTIADLSGGEQPAVSRVIDQMLVEEPEKIAPPSFSVEILRNWTWSARR